MSKALVGALLVFGLSACVPYPAYRTIQPDAELQVVDESGRPLAGASVTLIARARPTPIEQSRETRLTNANGIAHFSSRQRWQTELLFLHGRLDYYWQWCVTAPGRATQLAFFVTPLQVQLQLGTPEPCPPPRD